MSINMTKSILISVLLLSMPLAQATPDIEHWQTSRGIDVYFVQADELPMVDVQLVFDAGSARDGGKLGLANLTLNLLDDGVAGMSGDEISTVFESVGARYGASLDQDMAQLTLRSLTEPEPLATAVDMLRKVMSQPDFP
ncbi:MAG: insulinase family protein, partial [Gammaproteobacteria bacterium]